MSARSKIDIQMPVNAKGYLVLGNALGSGEQLLINQILNRIPPFRAVFICYQEALIACSNYVRENYSNPIEKIISLNELESVKGGIVNVDWTNPAQLKLLLDKISLIESSCVLIFASGSNVGSEIKDRLDLISDLCNKLFISVNIHDPESFYSAKRLANDQSLRRLNFGCWQKIDLDEGYQHNFKIFSASEFKEYFAGR